MCKDNRQTKTKLSTYKLDRIVSMPVFRGQALAGLTYAYD